MQTKSDIQSFIDGWVAKNVRSVCVSNIPSEVNRLAASMTGDAREQGISGGDLHQAVGDIDDYLTARYEQARAAAA